METLFIGKNTLFLIEVESTNTYAMNMLRNVNAIDGTVIHTDNQTEGKGQRGALWSSAAAQNITASIILKPSFLSIEHSFYLSKISALAVYDVLTDILPHSQYDIKIKWPNDILVNKKKIAGILIENVFHHQLIQHSVVGIGLNVNQVKFEGFENMVTSLKLLVNRDFDRGQILEMLCIKLEKWYLNLRQKKTDLIDSSYLNYLFGMNQILSFMDAHKNYFDAKILGVTTEGKLKLEFVDLSVNFFEIKELKFLTENL